MITLVHVAIIAIFGTIQHCYRTTDHIINHITCINRRLLYQNMYMIYLNNNNNNNVTNLYSAILCMHISMKWAICILLGVPGTHTLKSNRPNCANWLFWQINLANQPNFYLASNDLHSPLLTADSWARPPIKRRSVEPVPPLNYDPQLAVIAVKFRSASHGC